MLTRRQSTEVPKSESNVDYKNLELGDHEGRLALVADLGLQRKEFSGEHKGNFQQLALGIEILGEVFEMDGVTKPVMLWTKPFYVYDTLTEKGNELVYALAFDSAAHEGQLFDWDSVLGEACNVVVSHTPDKQDPNKKYDNIARLTAIPAKYRSAVPEMKMSTATGDGTDVTSHFYGLVDYVYKQKLYAEAAMDDNATTQQQPVSDDFDDMDTPF